MSGHIRILVADDHPVVRDGLVAILGTQPDFQVVGEVSTGAELIARAGQDQPDVVLTDIEMPLVDGVQAIGEVRHRFPQIEFIVFTAFDTDERIISAVRAGAKGYLLKGAPREDIFKAIRVVSQGGSLLEPVVASKLLQHLSGENRSDPGLPEALTEREMDVLRLLGQGKPNRKIAAELFITERTVKFYVSAILGKLGAGNRTEAVTIAVQRGLIKL